MKNYFSKIFIVIIASFLIACGTTDGALKDQGRSESYIQGFHDGRHSGMKEEGNNFEHYLKDEARFASDPGYKTGWLAGEVEGKALQDQAASIGNAAATVYTGSQINKEIKKDTNFDKIAKDAVKGANTSGLENLAN